MTGLVTDERFRSASRRRASIRSGPSALAAIDAALADAGLPPRCVRVAARPATRAELERAHSRRVPRLARGAPSAPAAQRLARSRHLLLRRQLDGGAARRGRHASTWRAASPPVSSTTAPPSCARPATTPRATAPWASASSTTSPSPPRCCATSGAARRHLRLGRAPRQRHRGHLRRGARRPLHLDARVAAVSRAPAAPTIAGRGRGLGATRQRAAAARHRRPTPILAAYRARIRPALAALRARRHPRLGRLRRPRRRPARRPRARRGHLRRP